VVQLQLARILCLPVPCTMSFCGRRGDLVANRPGADSGLTFGILTGQLDRAHVQWSQMLWFYQVHISYQSMSWYSVIVQL
jgi:hypothetical protein